MDEVRIRFVDFWPSFNEQNNFIIRVLSQKYRVIVSDNPDYLFYSCFGHDNLGFDCIKIFYTPENIVPDFNDCDYAIGFHYIDFEDRYVRIPLSAIRKSYKNLLSKEQCAQKALNRKFCNFLYSNQNSAHPVRNDFFLALSKYKKVDSGGRVLNNMGGPVQDKLAFLGDYKFTIAFENSSVGGYVTEKIVDPMSVNSIPIYWGNPKISFDFNPRSFISMSGERKQDIVTTVDKIIELDQNDELYLQMFSEPWLKQGQFIEYESVLIDFFDSIIAQDYYLARRVTRYGRSMLNTQRKQKPYKKHNKIRVFCSSSINLALQKIVRKISRAKKKTH